MEANDTGAQHGVAKGSKRNVNSFPPLVISVGGGGGGGAGYNGSPGASTQVIDVITLLRHVTTDILTSELLFRATGIEMEGDHYEKTPERFFKMLKEMTTSEPFDFTRFPNKDTTEMVVIKDITFYTLCQHHVVPFFGKAHVGYIPDRHIAGLSKFARLVRNMAKGLWVQENLTTEIANAIEARLSPIGTAVVIEARHLCMEARGIKAEGAATTTSAMRGAYLERDNQARAEFFHLIRN